MLCSEGAMPVSLAKLALEVGPRPTWSPSRLPDLKYKKNPLCKSLLQIVDVQMLSLSLPNREEREAGGCCRALPAVAQATRLKLGKHVLVAAAILLPRGVLRGRKQTLYGDEEWEKGEEKHDPPVVRESKGLGRQEGCTPSAVSAAAPWVLAVPCCWGAQSNP